MAENDAYTLPRNPKREEENEYLELQPTSSDIPINTSNGRVRFDQGPWTNQSKEAYSRTVENTSAKSLKEPLAQHTFYVYLLGGILIFILGLLLGILIGYFAIKIHSHSEPKRNRLSPGSLAITGTTPDVSGFVGGQTTTPRLQTRTTTFETTTEPDTISTTRPPTSSSPFNATITTTESSTGSICTCPSHTPVPPSSTTVAATCSLCERESPYVELQESNVKSLFAPLTDSETNQVIRKLEKDGIIATRKRSYFGTNYINYIYLFPVAKTIALDYLDNNGPVPNRYAKVHVTRGTANPPDIMIYKVGPVNETISNMVVEKQVKDGDIHFNRRSYDTREFRKLNNLFKRSLDAMKDVLRESFDGASFRRGISVGRSSLFSLDENDRRSGCYLYLYMDSGGSTLRILPLSFIAHHPGINTTAWNTSDFYYMNQGPFNSSGELANAYRNGTLRKFRLPENYRQNYSLEYDLQRNNSLPLRHLSDIPPPRTYEPKGPRYRIDKNKVYWMDWKCEFSVHPFKGPALFNINFKGKRIAYEISLQDIILVYASGTTGAGIDPPVISDTEFSLGSAIRDSRAGFGCPDRASYLYNYVYVVTETFQKEVACVFEADGQRPLWRHGSTGLLDHHLIIRSSMNLGNYDYTLEFRFYLDGRIQTIITSSGILYGAFWDAEDPLLDEDKSTSPFGFRVGNILSGPIHTHDFLFKVDLDILGTNNSFQKINWKGGDVLTALQTERNTQEKPRFFPFNITRYIETEFLEKETGLVVDPVNSSYWTVVNENEKNRWGVIRGYRIIPSFSESEPELFTQHLVFGPWLNMKYHCAVTKRKDEEPYGTDSIYDIRRPTEPRGGLVNLMNDENIRNEDLVAWINAKFVHVPTSEDVPMTLGIDKGFVLKPFNYFDTTPTFDLPGHYHKKNNPYEKIQCAEP